MMTENMTLDNDTRQELANYAVELLYDHLYDDITRNASKLEENDRYYNWYHGYTLIQLPMMTDDGRFKYNVDTAVSSGTISTQHFGDKFDADKVETNLIYTIKVYCPDIVRKNPNVTLHLDIEKVSMTDLSSGGEDSLKVVNTRVDTSHTSFNYTAPSQHHYDIRLDRKVLPADVIKQKLSMMPGFRLRWHYFGKEVESRAKWADEENTKAFVRNGVIH